MATRKRVVRWLASRRGPRLALLIGVLVSVPALGVGFLHDDLMHRMFIERRIPDYPVEPHALYDFTTSDPGMVARIIERGYMPWFTDPRLALRFLRPVSSLLLRADDALFGRAALPAHVHSLLWFVLIAIAATSIFRRVLRPSSATLASLVYCMAGAHAMTTSWLAARHTLVGATFGAIVVLSHVRWRNEGWRAGALIAPLALIAGMLSSETALGSVVFVVLYELVVRRESLKHRFLAAMPALGLGLAHLTFYALAGYGTRHSATYISPFDAPLAFASAIGARGPLLVAELYGAFPVLIASMVEPLQTPVAIYGFFAIATCALLLYYAPISGDERRRLLWLGSASVVCLAPMVGGPLGPRLLPLAMIGSAAVIGATIVETWQRARSQRGFTRFALRLAVIAFVFLHLGFSPLIRVSLPAALAKSAEDERRLAEEADLSACPDGADAYLLTGADPVLSMYAMPAMVLYDPDEVARLRRVRVLSMVPQGQELLVTGPDRFELRVIEEPRESNLFEHVYRSEPLRQGHVVTTDELTATVLEVENGLPTNVAFHDSRGLATACFLVYRDGKLRSIAPPPRDEPRIIVHELGPMGL